MPTLVFLAIASIGLYTTRILFGVIKRYDGYTNRLGALTFAFGICVTWLFSFLGPIAVANKFSIEFDIFIFIMTTSIGVWFLSYFIAVFLLNYFEKKRE